MPLSLEHKETITQPGGIRNFLGRPAGFTLIEVVIVMVIIAILASAGIAMITDPKGRLRSEAFRLIGDLNLARSEAVNRAQDVQVNFIFDTDIDGDGDTEDGYRIWVDDNGNGTYAAADDTLIKPEVAFSSNVRFYDQNITNGPDVIPGTATALNLGNGDYDDDGVDCDDGSGADDNGFFMQPDGTPSFSTNHDEYIVYLYIPGGANDMKAPPLAVVATVSTGRIRLDRWRPDLGTWFRK